MNIAEQLKGAIADALKPVLKPLVLKIFVEIVFPALEEKAKGSDTKIDDMILASVKVSAIDAIEKLEF